MGQEFGGKVGNICGVLYAALVFLKNASGPAWAFF
jgi:hypothetical protein